ncbi:indolepyruvate oxidoreductase subunit beta family protein [Azohydromonas australica]|uniref:indolepyruvate oxidoreductase subunit beta family protein n=1 Tax=Azohydromonas australica TaxID=364039 RepID=UPI0003F8FE90|nr:indolepyruvate oxidoreductase subunit beta family protein [Azohydromonas australica]
MIASYANVRPISIVIAAMGGEGGGVLADWIIDAANAHDFPVQSTSVPGVAQRTGATTYYLEVFPVSRAVLGAHRPVLSLTPAPGNVDLVAASELVEAGRMMQRGFVNAGRTVLVASTHREFAVSEKTAMADGRYDGTRVLDAAQRLAKQAILFDMRALAQQHGTVINTVVFGAMAGSGALPLSRQACEAAIRHAGKAVDASLRGFAAGWEAATQGLPQTKAVPTKQSLAGIGSQVRELPEPLHDIAAAGVEQTCDYQDAAYASLYLDRVRRLCEAERLAGSSTFEVTREVARYLALWMSYEDVIRVADLKTRRSRLERVRREVGARQDEPVRLTEFLKPGLDEVCSVLPPGMSAWLRRRLEHKAHKLGVGLHLRTDTVSGFALLCLLRSLKVWRRHSARYAVEQQMIQHWLQAVHLALESSPELAHELALCGNLVKGYGQTSERGHRNLCAILDDVLQHQALDPGLAERVRQARQAAMADPQGRQLAAALGLPVPEPVAQPIRIVRKAAAS